MKKCLICSKEFTGKRSDAKYCSLKCSKEGKYKMDRRFNPVFSWKVEKVCDICNKIFIPIHPTQKRCLGRCVIDYKLQWKENKRLSKLPEIKCPQCGKTFTAKWLGVVKFCSKECADKKYQLDKGIQVGYRGTENICKMCGKTFNSYTTTQKWCSKKCRRTADYRQNYFTKIKSILSRKLKKKGLGGSFTKEQWNKLVRERNGICRLCNQKCDKFTIDHHIPISKWNEWIKGHLEITYKCGDIENIEPTCLRCNILKSNKIL